MPNLILIKHSLPQIVPTAPAAEWPLSAEGRARCRSLAAAIADYHPATIFASTEPKAAETARLLANYLGLAYAVSPKLHEHARQTVPWLDATHFSALVARLFAQPSCLVMGEESADQAHSRFARTVDTLVTAHPQDTLAVVAHGTVISLYVARATGSDPFPLWQRLGLPSFVVLALPSRNLAAVVDSIESGRS